MFDSKLTIESGIDRLGEIVDGRQINVLPNDPIFEQVREYHKAIQCLYDNDAIEVDPFEGGSISLLKPEFKNEMDKVLPGGKSILATWYKTQASTRYSCSASSDMRNVFNEAFFNALEYGSEGGININHLVGRKGEFYSIVQVSGGPIMEDMRDTFVEGKSLRFVNTKYPRGCGSYNFGASSCSVWYANLDPGYATLIFDKSSGYLHDRGIQR